MKKNIIKIIAIIAIIVLCIASFSMISCNYKEDTKEDTKEDNTNSFDENGFWNGECVNVTREELDEIISKKNKDVEMEVKSTPYTSDELYENVVATNVYIWERKTNSNPTCFNGNIYDIDDNYIYIITCRHGIDYSRCDTKENNYNLDYLRLKFLTDEICEVKLENIFVSEETDLMLLVVDKNEVSNETLEVLKTINIDNIYSTNLNDTNIIGIMRNNTNEYHTYNITETSVARCKELRVVSNVVNGCSGGGYFDEYGNYCGFAKTVVLNIYYKIFPYYYDLIKEFNPNY